MFSKMPTTYILKALPTLTTAQHYLSQPTGRGTLHILFLALLIPTYSSSQSDTLRLIFTGDIMGHAPQITSAEISPGQYDYHHCFQFVKKEIMEADLAIGNLELTLPGKPPYTGYPMFKSPDALATALWNTGFDLLVTANNHSNDGRKNGVMKTIQTLRKLGFAQTGTFLNQLDRDLFYPLIAYKNDFKLAFLNYTYGTNGVPTDTPTIVNLIDTLLIAKDIQEAKARKPHFIIAIMHWGLEYQLTENKEQRALATFLINNDVDMIVGMHPHVVQPIKTESINGKKALVAYSLGNFISNQQQPNTDVGVMLQVDLVKPKQANKAFLLNYKVIPTWRYIHKPLHQKPKFYVLPSRLLDTWKAEIADMDPVALQKMKTQLLLLQKRIDIPSPN
jgi:poly-gamma-glutamate capsule biosynthesis protein CapA/YwtB (metallophosphatase superfamily)